MNLSSFLNDRSNHSSKEKPPIELHYFPTEKDCLEGENSEIDEKQSSSNDTESVCEICRRLNKVKQSIPMVTRSISFSNTWATETIIDSDLISRNSVPECLGVCV